MYNKNLLYSIFIVIFTLFLLVSWPHFFKREKNARMQRSVYFFMIYMKKFYDIFPKIFQFSGQTSILLIKTETLRSTIVAELLSPLYSLEMDRVTRILDLKLSDEERSLSNQEAKLLYFKELALPLQSVCQ